MINNTAFAQRLNGYPDMALSLALLLVAIVLVAVAISPVNHWIKALVLAWVILP